MVRGGLAINDATIEDAQEIGLTKIVPVISNGAAIAGTVKEQLSKEARKQLDSADVLSLIHILFFSFSYLVINDEI